MKNAVFDSYAILAYLGDEKGSTIVVDYLSQALEGKKNIFISSVNWAEVGYQCIRRQGIHGWKSIQARLLEFPIQIVETDHSQTEHAAEFKASNKMSLADAYAAALTVQKRAELLTGDPEFNAVEAKLKKIIWLNK